MSIPAGCNIWNFSLNFMKPGEEHLNPSGLKENIQ